jgi:hypothetical protein
MIVAIVIKIVIKVIKDISENNPVLLPNPRRALSNVFLFDWERRASLRQIGLCFHGSTFLRGLGFASTRMVGSLRPIITM